MDSKWGERISALKRRYTDEVEAKEFVSLVDEAVGKCTPEVVRVLMRTFTADEDYGIQESVVSALASAGPEVYLRALLEELPRLLEEAPKWAEVLIGREVEFNSLLLASTAKEMDVAIKESLIRLLTQDAFAEFYPNAKQILKEVRNG